MRQLLSDLKTAVYRKPLDEIKRLRRWGPTAYFRLAAWQEQMAQRARTLPLLVPKGENAPVELWFLTGRKFWYQTAFCAWTFAKHSERSVQLNIIDDGSLRAEDETEIRRLFPNGKTIRQSSISEKIDELLPTEKFPVLRQRWSDYINIRKLIDVHLGSTGRKLVLDSDMLFFDRPTKILEWIDGDSQQPLLMTDCEESYGYSRSLMRNLCGKEIPPLLNVGVCGLNSDWLHWEKLEFWCRSLGEREGTSYYLEQALVAMMAAERDAKVLPVKEYITFPTLTQCQRGTGTMQHYVADSKPGYFSHAWKVALNR